MAATKKKDYIATVGRRKAAIARVRLHPNAEALKVTVNGKDFKEYFNYFEWQEILLAPLSKTGRQRAEVSVKVEGGGIKSQAEAIRLGIARALVAEDETLRPTLRKEGFLTRDARIKERKKPGLKKARRAPQWSKR